MRLGGHAHCYAPPAFLRSSAVSAAAAGTGDRAGRAGPGRKAEGTADHRDNRGRPTRPLASAWFLLGHLFSLSLLAAALSLPQELQGEDDHEDFSAAELGVP